VFAFFDAWLSILIKIQNSMNTELTKGENYDIEKQTDIIRQIDLAQKKYFRNTSEILQKYLNQPVQMRMTAMFPKDFRLIWIVVMSLKVRIMQMAILDPIVFCLQIIQMLQLKMTYHLHPRVISKRKTLISKILYPG
jgi:hypothetical protein